jgi:hypothetical protein
VVQGVLWVLLAVAAAGISSSIFFLISSSKDRRLQHWAGLEEVAALGGV